MYGGLSRPTALDSDSPFAIASHALNDKSTPTAPTLKIPTRRAPPGVPSPSLHSPGPGSGHSQGQAQVQGDWRQPHGPGPHPQQQQQQQGHPGPMQSPGGSGGYGLREGARDAYMGAGAYDSRTGRYGPSATPAFPPQHQHQYQQQQQQPQQQQGGSGPPGGYGSPQTQSRQPGGYGQPYPQPPYQQPPPPQQQRPVTAQPPPPQAPTGPYPLVERPSRSPQPVQQPQHHQQAYPYASSPAATSPPQYPNPTSSPYAPHHTHTPSPAQLANASAASPGYYQTTSPGTSGPIPTVVNPNQLQTRPPVQAQGQGQGGQAPRRQDSKDSAGGQELWEMYVAHLQPSIFYRRLA